MKIGLLCLICYFEEGVFIMNLNNMTAREVCDYIMKHHREIKEEEWLEIDDWIAEFLKNDPPPEEKKMFIPLGCAEVVSMICDGILRWRNSICIRCKRQQGYDKYSCSVYQENEEMLGGIPNEIWARENADCPYFKE